MAPGAPSLDLLGEGGTLIFAGRLHLRHLRQVLGIMTHLRAVAVPCPPLPGAAATGSSALPESGSSPPRVHLSGLRSGAGCPLRCGEWTFFSSHKSKPAILGPPPSLEMFIGDCVYSAVTARKRSDIITSDQSPPPAPGQAGTSWVVFSLQRPSPSPRADVTLSVHSDY